ncbi:MAG: DUF2066 domain-containing protein, partial [Sphingomonadales bacterium]
PVVTFLAAALMTTFACAGVEEIFTVTNVSVDVTAQTAARARSMAVAGGQREALAQLFARLTLREDAGRLPVLDDPSIANLVAGLEFANEKSSSRRYIADLTVRFDPDRIRNLLRVTGIPFSATPAKPVLVLPVYEAGGLTTLWDDTNPWRDAWRRHSTIQSLLPLILPRGDLQEIGMISARDVVSGNRRRLSAIASRYGVAEILIAHAKLDFAPGGRKPVVTVETTRLGTAGERTATEIFAGEDSDSHTLLESAADALASALEEEWKLQTLIEFGAEITLEATVPLSGLQHWLEVRRRLAQIASIRRIELLSISIDEARVVLHYLGNPGQLMIALAQSDVDLVEKGETFSIVLAPSSADRTELGEGTDD